MILYLWPPAFAGAGSIQFATARRARIWQSGQRRYMPPVMRWSIIYRGTSVGCLN